MSVGVGVVAYQKWEKPLADPYWNAHGGAGPGADQASLYAQAAFAEPLRYVTQAEAVAAGWTIAAGWAMGSGVIGTSSAAVSNAISRALTGLLGTTAYELALSLFVHAGSLQVSIVGPGNVGGALTTTGGIILPFTTVGAAPVLSITGTNFQGAVAGFEVRRVGNAVYAAWRTANAGDVT